VLEAGTQLDLAFRVPGRVASVGQLAVDGGLRTLQEGDPVRPGDVLATLDLDDLRRHQSAAASAVTGAAAQVRTARTNLAQAEKEVARARRLFAGGDLAQAELDRAESAFAAATSSLAALEAQEQGRVDQLALSRSTWPTRRCAAPSRASSRARPSTPESWWPQPAALLRGRPLGAAPRLRSA
jgi:multidrug resistance efflux pump